VSAVSLTVKITKDSEGFIFNLKRQKTAS
jgi:hypothetical protein